MTSGLCPSIPPFLTGLMGLSVWLASSPKPPLLFPKLVLCHSCHRQLRLVIVIAGTTGTLRIISCVTSAPASLPIHFLSICLLSTKTCIIRLCNSCPAPLLYTMRTLQQYALGRHCIVASCDSWSSFLAWMTLVRLVIFI